MKPTIDKDAFEKLPAALQALYEAAGDGYKLKEEFASYATPDDTSPEALLRAKQHEKDRRKDAEKRAKEAEDKLAAIKAAEDAAKLKGIREGGDLEALEASYKAKIAEAEKAAKAEQARLNAALASATVGRTAAQMAAEISTAPALVEDIIRRRLKAEITEDGTVIERVLDQAGKPSASTLEDLKKEISGREDLKPVIKSHSGKGGGATKTGEKEGSSPIKLSMFTLNGGGVNWTKVSTEEKENPGFLKRFQAALAEAKENGEWPIKK